MAGVLWRWTAGLVCLLLLQMDAWAFGGSGVRVWLPEGITTSAPAIDRLFYIILGITGAVFVLVQATLLIFIVRYRRREGRRASYLHGNHLVEIVWTTIPACILLFLTLESQRVWSQVRGTPPRQTTRPR